MEESREGRGKEGKGRPHYGRNPRVRELSAAGRGHDAVGGPMGSRDS